MYPGAAHKVGASLEWWGGYEAGLPECSLLCPKLATTEVHQQLCDMEAVQASPESQPARIEVLPPRINVRQGGPPAHPHGQAAGSTAGGASHVSRTALQQPPVSQPEQGGYPNAPHIKKESGGTAIGAHGPSFMAGGGNATSAAASQPGAVGKGGSAGEAAAAAGKKPPRTRRKRDDRKALAMLYGELFARIPKQPTAETLASEFADKEIRVLMYGLLQLALVPFHLNSA